MQPFFRPWMTVFDALPTNKNFLPLVARSDTLKIFFAALGPLHQRSREAGARSETSGEARFTFGEATHFGLASIY